MANRIYKGQQTIYNRSKWRKLRKQKLDDTPICECCNKNFASNVHHIIPFEKVLERDSEIGYRMGFSYKNLASLCSECHKRVHKGFCYTKVEMEVLGINEDTSLLNNPKFIYFNKMTKLSVSKSIDTFLRRHND